MKSEISLQLLSVTGFSYTYFITYFISYFNENVLLTIIINRLSSTLKIVLINCQNFDLTNIYSIANLVQGTKIWNNSELSTPAYAAAAAYFGKTPPSFLKYGGVQHCYSNKTHLNLTILMFLNFITHIQLIYNFWQIIIMKLENPFSQARCSDMGHTRTPPKLA